MPKKDEAELKIKAKPEGLKETKASFEDLAKRADKAAAASKAVHHGLDKLKGSAMGLTDVLVEPFLVLATGGTAAQASIAGVKSALEYRILGPIGLLSFAALGATKKISALAKEFAKMGTESAGKLEMLATQFKPILQSAELASERVRMLVEVTKETPFKQEGVIEANRTLQIFSQGALATKESMLLIGDAAAAAGASMDEVAMWTGRLYDSLQSGAPIGMASLRMQQMGLITGNTRRELEELQANGASFADMWGIVAQQLGKTKGAMKDLSQTYEGLTSTFEDTRDVLEAEFSKHFLEAEKSSIRVTTKLMEAMTPVAEKLGYNFSILGNFIASVKEKFADWAIAAGLVESVIKTGLNVAMTVLYGAFIAGVVAAGQFALTMIRSAAAIKTAITTHVGVTAAMAAEQGVLTSLTAAKTALIAGDMAAVGANLKQAGSHLFTAATAEVEDIATIHLAGAKANLIAAGSALLRLQFANAAAHLRSAAAALVDAFAKNKASVATAILTGTMQALGGAIMWVITMMGKMIMMLVANPVVAFSMAAVALIGGLIKLGIAYHRAAEAAKAYDRATRDIISNNDQMISAIRTENDLLKARASLLDQLIAAEVEHQQAKEKAQKVKDEAPGLGKFSLKYLNPIKAWDWMRGKATGEGDFDTKFSNREVDATGKRAGALREQYGKASNYDWGKLEYSDEEKSIRENRRTTNLGMEESRKEAEIEKRREKMGTKELIGDLGKEISDLEAGTKAGEDEWKKKTESHVKRTNIDNEVAATQAKIGDKDVQQKLLEKKLEDFRGGYTVDPTMVGEETGVPTKLEATTDDYQQRALGGGEESEYVKKIKKEIEAIKAAKQELQDVVNKKTEGQIDIGLNESGELGQMEEILNMYSQYAIANETLEKAIADRQALQDKLKDMDKFEGWGEGLRSDTSDLENDHSRTEEYKKALAEQEALDKQIEAANNKRKLIEEKAKKTDAYDMMGNKTGKKLDITDQRDKNDIELAKKTKAEKLNKQLNEDRAKAEEKKRQKEALEKKYQEERFDRHIRYQQSVNELRDNAVDRQLEALRIEEKIIKRREKDSENKGEELERIERERAKIIAESKKAQEQASTEVKIGHKGVQEEEARRQGRIADADRIEKERIDLERDLNNKKITKDADQMFGSGEGDKAAREAYIKARKEEFEAKKKEEWAGREENRRKAKESYQSEEDTSTNEWLEKASKAMGDTAQSEVYKKAKYKEQDATMMRDIVDSLTPHIGKEKAQQEAERRVGVHQKQREFDDIQNQTGEAKIIAQSMAAIGGGGRVVGTDPVVNKLEKQIELLKQIKDAIGKDTKVTTLKP